MATPGGGSKWRTSERAARRIIDTLWHPAGIATAKPMTHTSAMAKSILGSAKLVAFAATSQPAKALRFYRDVLGLTLVEESPFAFVFDAHGTMLRVTPVEKVAVGGYTVLGWDVKDIGATIKALAAGGVTFNRYPGMDQDELGVWTSPSGARIAWFKDPDGNTLSVSEF